jgi:hypothetical protein
MGEDVDVAGDSELPSQLCARSRAVEVAGDCRSFAPLRMTIRGGGVTRDPLPLPVREGLVYQVSNHEVMDCPEHQIRLSKGITAKFVQPLDLGSAIQAGAPATRVLGSLRCRLRVHLWAT